MDKFLAGVIVGIMGAAFVAQLPSSDIAKARAQITDCEKSLPRDQNCKLIALPVDKE
jgi:hypothetical protein